MQVTTSVHTSLQIRLKLLAQVKVLRSIGSRTPLPPSELAFQTRETLPFLQKWRSCADSTRTQPSFFRRSSARCGSSTNPSNSNSMSHLDTYKETPISNASKGNTNPSRSPEGQGLHSPSYRTASYGLRGEQCRRSIKWRHHRSAPLVMTLLGTSYAFDNAGSTFSFALLAKSTGDCAI